MSGAMGSLGTAYDNYVKPNICAFGVTAAAMYFLTPILAPQLGSLPVVGNLLQSTEARVSVLAGLYAGASIYLCQQFQLI